MKIAWRVSDGYVGHGPQCTKVSDEWILECENVDEAMQMIDESLENDFQQTVSFCYNRDEVKKEVEQLFANKPKEEN